jgi:light-regulated signal transduction histidine kinase (bacteriophytochrome)
MTANRLEPVSDLCDKEPIHIPGKIQSHGMLFVLSAKLEVEQVSENAMAFLGIDPKQILGQRIDSVIDNSESIIATNLHQLEKGQIQSFLITHQEKQYQAVLHRNNSDRIVLELEEEAFDDNEQGQDLYRMVVEAVGSLENAKTLQALYEIIAEQVREFIGYDRVVIYRFDSDWHGQVVAESRIDSVPSFLDLHFPATDIPKQARELYVRNRTRIVTDVDSEPVGLYCHEGDTEPLDMSDAILRAVSPVHIEYLRNMQVGASMSISILKDGELWGLIACHHQTAKHVSYQVRAICKLLSLTVSTQLVSKQQKKASDKEIHSAELQRTIFEELLNAVDPMVALPKLIGEVQKLIPSSGSAIWLNDSLITTGNTPNASDLKDFIMWYSLEGEEIMLRTNRWSELYSPAKSFVEVASGILLIKVSSNLNQYIMWFRPEQIQQVNWSGKPTKLTKVDENGETRLSPRKSFEKWSEEVRHSADEWDDTDVDSALQLRSNIVDVILRRVNDLEHLNLRLERSNLELDAFAYIASHDLKEPLRGISNFASIVLRRYAEVIDDDGKHKLGTIVKLTTRLDSLLDSLMNFSRVGRLELKLDPIDFNKVVTDVVEGIHANQNMEKVEISILKTLPTARADLAQITEVFANLIGNSIKYNTSDITKIEIGYEESDGSFFVRDNGIGIEPNQFDSIFQIFRRLHAREDFGGGTGAGLTIVRKIIERHNGRIWIESVPGQGTTLSFTINDTRGEI